MDFKKLLGLPLAFIVLLTLGLASCFSATDYEREPQVPGEPQEQQGIRVFNNLTAGSDQLGGSPPTTRDLNTTPVNFTSGELNHVRIFGENSWNRSEHGILMFLVPSTIEDVKERFFINLSSLPTNSHQHMSVSYQQLFFQRYIFIGRYNGSGNYMHLTNANGASAIFETVQTPQAYGVMNRLYNNVLSNELMDTHNIYFIVVPTTNTPSRQVRGYFNRISSFIGATHIIHDLTLTDNYITNNGRTRIRIQKELPPIDELPEELRPPVPDIPDDNDIVPGEPNEPEVPGDDGNDNEPGTDEDQDNGDNGDNGNDDDNGYEPTPEIAHLSWWQQFRNWLRRLLLQ